MGNIPWYLASMGGTTVKLTFLFTGIWIFYMRMRGKDAPDAVRWAFRLAKRCYPVAAPVYWIAQVVLYGPLDGWDAFGIGLDWWNYRGLKDEDDDDAWKRLRAKVGDVVQSLGHRLVVVPGNG